MAEKPESIVISAKEALADYKKRLDTGEAKRNGAVLLQPSELMRGKKNAGDLWREMFTRDGGQGEKRQLTVEDMRRFNDEVKRLKTRYGGGVRMADVVNLSRQIDRQRATEQIHTGFPIAVRAGRIQFMTNAWIESKDTRHYVTVNFKNFTSLVAQPLPPKKIVDLVLQDACEVSCDCGRWRFWYAYMATIGGYNAARGSHREAAYPKERNPDLVGLGCKHVLRVAMNILKSPTVRGMLLKQVEMEQERVRSREKQAPLHSMQYMEQEMAKEGITVDKVRDAERKRQARTTDPDEMRRSVERSERAEKKMQDQARKISKKYAGSMADTVRRVSTMMEQGRLTKSQISQIEKILNAGGKSSKTKKGGKK